MGKGWAPNRELVRGATAELPILAVTDNADAGMHALHAGADSIVPKPLSPEEVRLRIGRVLERAGKVREVLGDAWSNSTAATTSSSPKAIRSTSAPPNSASSPA